MMKIANLEKFSEAPESGHVLAYTRKKVYFHSYASKEEVMTEFSNEDLLELHLFDGDKEYRAVMSESHRFSNGFVECVADFPEKNDEAYVSNADAFIEMNGEKKRTRLSIISHLQYDDKGMAWFNNYRLSLRKGDGDEVC